MTITINDVNEPPSFGLRIYHRGMEDRSPSGTEVVGPVTATDPDDGDTISYSLSGTDAGSFTVDSTTGQITVTVDNLAPAQYSMVLTATDSAGLTGTTQVVVIVVDSNRSPRFPQRLYTRTVPDGTQPGTNIGAPITATDPNGDDVTYSLTGTGSDRFAVDSNGQITAAAVLRHDDQATYNLTLTAADDRGGSEDTNVRITVSPPPPSIGSVSASVEDTEATITVTVRHPGTSAHTIYMRYRAGQSGWTEAQPQTTTTGRASFSITDLTRGQDYTVEASLSRNYASPASTTFTVDRPAAQPLSAGVEFEILDFTNNRFVLDPDTFEFFGDEYAIQGVSQGNDTLSMVLRGPCPPSWDVHSMVTRGIALTPTQSCTATNELTLRADVPDHTLLEGEILSMRVRSAHITDADPSDGMGHKRGSLRDTICALPDTVLGDSACIPLMLFVPPIAVVAVLMLVMGVTHPMVLSGAGFVAMVGMPHWCSPGR